MKYKQIFLENYKGIKDRLVVDLKLDSKTPHCIIGNNESGKTTILKGIEMVGRLCRGDSIQNGERNSIRPKGNYFSGVVKLGANLTCSKDLITEELLIKYSKSISDNHIELELTFCYTFENSAFSNNETEIKFAGSLITDKKDINAVYDLIRLYSAEIIYYEDFRFSVPKVISFPKGGTSIDVLTNSDRETNEFWQKVFDDILKGSSVQAVSFQNDIVDWSQDRNKDQTVVGDRLIGMEDYLNNTLHNWVKNKNSSIKGFNITRLPDNNSTESSENYQISVKAGDNRYEMNERSKGMQWAFCFHILTGIRKNRNENGVIFLLDEPASNLHIKLQNQMLQHLKDLCDYNSTVIYSTHAPELIGIEEDCYKNTFIAQNKATEFKGTDIHLINLIYADRSSVDIKELEPILAKLAYEDVKMLGTRETKVNWNNIAQQFKENFKLSKIAQVSTIANFVLNTVPNLFKS